MKKSSHLELCLAASKIYETGSFVNYTLAFRLLTTPFCIIGISLLVFAVYRTKSLHYNARSLLIFLTTSMTFCNIGVLMEAVYCSYVAWFMDPKLRCEYQVYRPNLVLALKLPFTVGGLGATTSTVCLACERTLATIKYRTYETNSYQWLGNCLFVGQTMVCLITIIYIQMVPEVLIVPYFTSELMETEGAIYYTLALWLTNAGSLFVYAALWKVNRTRTKTMNDSQLRVLSTRYQLKENISTTRLMVPIMISMLIISTSFTAIILIKLPQLAKNEVITSKLTKVIAEYAHFSHYQSSLWPFSTLFMIIVLLLLSPDIKRSFFRVAYLERFFVEKSRVDVAIKNKEGDVYFTTLEGAWRTSK